MLNSVIIQLLEILSVHPEGVSVVNLIDTLNVSRRVLYYNMGKANDALKDAHLPQISSDDGTLYLTAEGERLRERLLHNRSLDYVLSAQERQALICLYIGLHHEPITLELLSSVLEVSRNTVLTEMSEIKTLLERHDLSLRYKPREGYQIVGHEPYVRRYLIDAYASLQQSFLSTMTQKLLMSCLLETGCVLDEAVVWQSVRQLIRDTEEQTGVLYSDKTTWDLAAYVLICVIRSRSHIAQTPINLASFAQATAARTIAAGLQDMGIPLPAGEHNFITAILLGTKISFSDTDINSDDEQYIEFERELCDSFERIAFIKLSDQPDLKQAFGLHLRPMYYRLMCGVWTDNMQSQSILEQYHSYYVLAGLALRELENKYNFTSPQDEVAYLGIYLGSFLRGTVQSNGVQKKRRLLIVCGAGVCTSILLKQQIITLLGGTCIYDTAEERRLAEQLGKHKYDLVVSTAPLDIDKTQFLQVSTVLTALEREKLLKWGLYSKIENSNEIHLGEILSIVKKSTEIKDWEALVKGLLVYFDADCDPASSLHLKDVFLPDCIQFCSDRLTAQQAIEFACNPLVKSGLVDEGYAHEILEVIDELGLYAEYHDGILLAHAKYGASTHGVGVAITTFEQAVNFTKWERSIKVVIVLSTVDNHLHLHVLQELINILANADCRSKVMEYCGENPAELHASLMKQA